MVTAPIGDNGLSENKTTHNGIAQEASDKGMLPEAGNQAMFPEAAHK
jgi:hypothetical protein